MWLLVSRRLRQALILSVLAPLTVKGARVARLKLEQRGGVGRTTRALGLVERLGARFTGRRSR